MFVSWREVRETDLEACLRIDPRSMGAAIVEREDALRLWRGLLQELAFNAALVETQANAISKKIVSFGASVFLEGGYVNRELGCPRPDWNSRIFADMRAGKPVMRPVKSLSGKRKQEQLDLFLLSSSFQLLGLSPFEQDQVSTLLPRALVHLHTGYRIERILMETTNERMRLLAISSGVWKMLAHFPEEERALMAVTREEALGSAGFMILAPLFVQNEARLGLRDAEKKLLCEAMHGDTDMDLAGQLGLSVSSVKKRWSTVYQRIEMALPDLLPKAERGSANDSRGAQKRHRVLAYVRDHPEEVRPFRWYPGRTNLGV